MTGDQSAHDGRAAPPGRGLLAVMAAGLYLALIVMTWGVMSFVLDRDVIEIADAGPLIAPVMVAVSAVLVFTIVFRAGSARNFADPAFAGLGAIIVGPSVGAVVLAGVSGQPLASVVYFGQFILSPFMVAAAVVAAIVVAVFGFVPRRR